ncbi:MAG: hypothetical protein KJ922_03370, partial [Nanoarchaeota archaeon]|nr:hypothetical protein [Nanoarchaeota archaeon]
MINANPDGTATLDTPMYQTNTEAILRPGALERIASSVASRVKNVAVSIPDFAVSLVGDSLDVIGALVGKDSLGQAVYNAYSKAGELAYHAAGIGQTSHERAAAQIMSEAQAHNYTEAQIAARTRQLSEGRNTVRRAIAQTLAREGTIEKVSDAYTKEEGAVSRGGIVIGYRADGIADKEGNTDIYHSLKRNLSGELSTGLIIGSMAVGGAYAAAKVGASSAAAATSSALGYLGKRAAVGAGFGAAKGTALSSEGLVERFGADNIDRFMNSAERVAGLGIYSATFGALGMGAEGAAYGSRKGASAASAALEASGHDGLAKAVRVAGAVGQVGAFAVEAGMNAYLIDSIVAESSGANYLKENTRVGAAFAHGSQALEGAAHTVKEKSLDTLSAAIQAAAIPFTGSSAYADDAVPTAVNPLAAEAAEFKKAAEQHFANREYAKGVELLTKAAQADAELAKELPDLLAGINAYAKGDNKAGYDSLGRADAADGTKGNDSYISTLHQQLGFQILETAAVGEAKQLFDQHKYAEAATRMSQVDAIDNKAGTPLGIAEFAADLQIIADAYQRAKDGDVASAVDYLPKVHNQRLVEGLAAKWQAEAAANAPAPDLAANTPAPDANAPAKAQKSASDMWYSVMTEARVEDANLDRSGKLIGELVTENNQYASHAGQRIGHHAVDAAKGLVVDGVGKGVLGTLDAITDRTLSRLANAVLPGTPIKYGQDNGYAANLGHSAKHIVTGPVDTVRAVADTG